MKAYSLHASMAALVLALAIAVGAPATLLAQGDGENAKNMTLQDVKDRLKENKKHLDEARKRGKAGDAPGMEKALQNYERGMDGLDRAMSQGRFEGTLEQRENAFDRVQSATRKHGDVLSDLLASGKLPEQARPHVEHALQMSQKGRQTALANLDQTRTARREHEAAQHRQGMGQPDVYGRSAGSGRSGGMGGPPSGAGGGASGNPGASRGRGPR